MRSRTSLRSSGTTLVIGVGNRWRRDDGVGLAVADGLALLSPSNVKVQHCEMDPLTLLDRDLGNQRLILIDAVHAQRGPCRVYRFDGQKAPLERALTTSSHSFGLAETIELGRRLNRWPNQMAIYAVEGWDFSHGKGLSPEAAAAARECLRLLVGEISELT